MNTGDDILAEAEAALDEVEGDPLAADSVEGNASGDEDYDGEVGEDLGCGTADTEGDASTQPLYRIGVDVMLLQGDGSFRLCTIVAAEKSDMGPLYAVKFADGLGHEQSCVPESQLRPASASVA
mmetsp:Transcript_16787/g.38887  ORF Transcript_16787/g.38887 Transcript_16787/m.38887 type:complete len:124 (-) Transcript_16787:163-534(-)